MTSTGYSSLLCSWESLPNDIVSIAEYLIRITSEQAFATCTRMSASNIRELDKENREKKINQLTKKKWIDTEEKRERKKYAFDRRQHVVSNMKTRSTLIILMMITSSWKFRNFPTGYTFYVSFFNSSFMRDAVFFFSEFFCLLFHSVI